MIWEYLGLVGLLRLAFWDRELVRIITVRVSASVSFTVTIGVQIPNGDYFWCPNSRPRPVFCIH